MDSIFAFHHTQIQKEFKGILFMSLPPQRKKITFYKTKIEKEKYNKTRFHTTREFTLYCFNSSVCKRKSSKISMEL